MRLNRSFGGIALLLLAGACGASDDDSASPGDPSATPDGGGDTGIGEGTPGDGAVSDGASNEDGGGATDDASDGSPGADGGSDSASDGAADAGPTWSAESTFTLSLPPAAGNVSLTLDRAGINGVLSAAEQQSFDVLTFDIASLVDTRLAAMTDLCGTGWKLDAADPAWDCSAQGWTGSDGTWVTSRDFALVRLLTTTPANARVNGTSLGGLDTVATAFGIGGGYQQLLADLLGISRTTAIFARTQFVDAFKTKFVASHPNASTGNLAVRFYDAMNNLSTLGARFGPIVNGHAGVLDAASPPSSNVLGATFSVTANGTSNVRAFDGVVLGNASAAAGKLANIVGATDPSTLDLSAGALTLSNLTVAPTVNLRFLVQERATKIGACVGDTCKTNTPAAPFGTTYVWSTPAWSLEYVAATAARTRWLTRSGISNSYVLGGAVTTVGYNGDPAGWMTFTTTAGIGNPPSPQYLWEGVSEIGQAVLHQFSVAGQAKTLAEGQANAAFTVNANAALSDSTVKAGLAPKLADHASALATMASGNWKANNADVDFYLRAGEDGSVQLWFPTAADPRPSMMYPYTSVGFFDDVALTNKVSATSIAGTSDTAHEKVALAAGVRVLYARAATGAVWRLTVTYAAAGTSAEVKVARLL